MVAGCVPQGDNFIEGLNDVSIIGVTQIDRVVEVVEETLKGNSVQLLKKKDLPELNMPKIRKNKYIEMYIRLMQHRNQHGMPRQLHILQDQTRKRSFGKL